MNTKKFLKKKKKFNEDKNVSEAFIKEYNVEVLAHINTKKNKSKN